MVYALQACWHMKTCQHMSAWYTWYTMHSSGTSCKHGMLIYHETSNITHTLVGNIIIDNSDVVGASPVGAAPTTSSFST